MTIIAKSFLLVIVLIVSLALKTMSLLLKTNHRQMTFQRLARSSVRLYAVDTALAEQIKAVGEKIRLLKKDKADKDALAPHIDELLKLKQNYQEVTGVPFDPPSSTTAKKPKEQKIQQQPNAGSDKTVESILITPRNEDYSAWYSDVISAADMADQSPVRGCMVIKPWGMAIWDKLRADLDERIQDTGTSNAYFPLFIPKSFLAKEAEHVDGFAKECAVVTHHRLCVSPDGKDLIPDPDAKLEEPLVVRPTSETVIWNMFSKWINSHRDLPLKLNQWANVVRWELRTRPFLRSAEFLWQEGHTAHATADDAVKTAREMLDVYSSVCEDMLAMPTVKGQKSPSERFAGADDTYTIEALMQNGWALQSGTSHFLGQNFAKAFDVYFQNDKNERELVWATSWGVSTRLIGALVMTHSDDKGLVLPPPVAPVQVVIVPITKGNGPEHDNVMKEVQGIVASLKSKKVRVKVDDRDNMRPGAKYFEWERKGVPLRIDIGLRDVSAKAVPMTVRYSGEKSTLSITDLNTMSSTVQSQLDKIHKDLFVKAQNRIAEKTFKLSSYSEMKAMIQESTSGSTDSESSGKGNFQNAGFYLVPWKCDAKNEDAIKADCKATIRCYPLDLNKSPPGPDVKCFYSGEKATHWAIFARAF